MQMFAPGTLGKARHHADAVATSQILAHEARFAESEYVRVANWRAAIQVTRRGADL